ncbi:MAG: type II secretion system protein GspM [candidate division KSB1 bacterium]|nr:type II secretion system protein GspM [candidate division KSB1 bacterium]
MLRFWQQANANEKRLILLTAMLVLVLLSFLGVYRPLKMWQARKTELAELERRIMSMQQQLETLATDDETAEGKTGQTKVGRSSSDMTVSQKMAYLLTTRWPGLQVQELEYRSAESSDDERERLQIQIRGSYPTLRSYLTFLKEHAGVRFENVKIRNAPALAGKAIDPGQMVMVLTVDPGAQ